MNPFKLLLCVLVFGIAITTEAETSEDSTPKNELTELFSSQTYPGEGTLIFSDESETENIVLGSDSGIYGLALNLKGEWLPSPYKNQFSKKTIIQVALGTLKTKLEGKVPQFGIATFIASELPKDTTAFTFRAPGEKNPTNSPLAILYFTSPKNQLGRSEQEKLQSTFFGREGGVTLTPVGKLEQVAINASGNKISFKKQKIKFDFQATLSTPFNGLEKKLSGSIVFPVYTPIGKAAESLATRLGGTLDETQPRLKKGADPERKITQIPPKAPKSLQPKTQKSSSVLEEPDTGGLSN
ncbi:MAG: hypothetical protein ACKOA8_08140 [Deltaproteobacteria bacterium]